MSKKIAIEETILNQNYCKNRKRIQIIFIQNIQEMEKDKAPFKERVKIILLKNNISIFA